jgi:hypothetical protein
MSTSRVCGAPRLAAISCLAAAWCWAAVPAPKEYFGFTPGDDYKLANYSEISGYFRKLEQASDRVRLVEFGKTANGRPMFLALISSAENLKNAGRHREISRRLALGQATPEEARRMAAEGKAIVWIDSGLHATEVAPAQHSPELAFRLATDEGEEAQRIRRSVILLQVPAINPDGLDMVVEWHRRNVGTPYERAGLPWLYHKYAGHDNNRDWFMLNLQETRNVTRVLFQEWFPQIVYNQHQTPPLPARIFLPPYADPLNPNIPPAVVAGINQIGSAMMERFARENKPGAMAFAGFDAWWDGGLRTVPAFHNMHGILTETAGYGYATPHEYKESELPERFSNGLPASEPTVFHPLPWRGGMWRLRDAVEYMLTADFAILDLASARPAHYLMKAYELARAAIAAGGKGSPYAYIVPLEQWDPSSAVEMLRRLSAGGIEIRRARAKFQAGGKAYPEGTWVLPAAQPFRAYLMDLLEPQKYPELRSGASGPVKRPYDIAGWTLSMQMGVTVDRVNAPFEAALEPVASIEPPAPVLDRRQNVSFLAIADALSRGEKVRWAADGAFVAGGEKAAYELKRPRVALYEPWTGNIDTGWTQWLLDHYRVPHTLVHNSDIREGGLRERFDSLILASQTAESILHGTLEGERGRQSGTPALQRPEYTGGIGVEGLNQLDRFVREGGTLLAFDAATELPSGFFGLPVRNAARASAESQAGAFYSPGSLLRATVEHGDPVAAGMPRQAVVFCSGGYAFEITLLPEYNKWERETRAVVQYADADLLASGWVSGEKAVLGKSILVNARHGKGRVLLYGFRPQFRGQPFGTFKLVLNAIYLASAVEL